MKFIPQSEKKIDNNRRICIPLDGLGLAETFYYTTLCKINPNIVINPVKTNPNAYNIASVFNEIATIEEIDEYKWNDYTWYESRFPRDHSVFNILDMAGVSSDDYIPYIKLNDEELDWGLKFCAQFDKPAIALCPFSGGYHKNCPNALGKMAPIEVWNILLKELSKKYTILCFGIKNNNYPIDNTVQCLDFPIRRQCAIMRACGKFLGIESGLTHAAIASGAFCHVLVPSFGYSNGLLFDNYAYKPEMWKYENRRVKYYLIKDFMDALNYF
jgi:hypothetical protein